MAARKPAREHVGRIASLRALPALQAVPELAAMGCRRLELPFGSPAYFDDTDPSTVSQLMKILKETGVCVQSVHLSFAEGTDIGEPDTAVRRAALDRQKEALRFAADLGATVAVQHPSLYREQEQRQQRIDIAADSVAELAEEAGRHGVTLAVENMLGTIVGCHEEELLRIISRSDPSHCGICFDSGHANLHGRVGELAAALLPRAVTTHLHDNGGTEDQHLFPGLGTIDWTALARVFHETHCTAMLMVESNNVTAQNWRESEAVVLRLMGREAAG